MALVCSRIFFDSTTAGIILIFLGLLTNEKKNKVSSVSQKVQTLWYIIFIGIGLFGAILLIIGHFLANQDVIIFIGAAFVSVAIAVLVIPLINIILNYFKNETR